MNSTLEGTDVMVREIPFRADGEVRISLASGELFLRGVDEDVVRIRSLDDRPVDQTVEVVIGEAQLDIRAVSETEIRIGPLTIGGHGSAELEVEVPRGSTVLAKTASGDIQASGLTGETRFATASGDVTVDEISGRVRFESMSGDVGIHASDAVDVDGRSVSGEVTLRAPRFRSLRLGSTSGDLAVLGELDPGAHDIQTISGDTVLTTQTGMRLETSTVTGDVRLRLQGISATDDGPHAFRIGDGAATVRWKIDVGRSHGPQRGEAGEAPDRYRCTFGHPHAGHARRPERAAAPGAARGAAAALRGPAVRPRARGGGGSAGRPEPLSRRRSGAGRAGRRRGHGTRGGPPAADRAPGSRSPGAAPGGGAGRGVCRRRRDPAGGAR